MKIFGKDSNSKFNLKGTMLKQLERTCYRSFEKSIFSLAVQSCLPGINQSGAVLSLLSLHYKTLCFGINQKPINSRPFHFNLIGHEIEMRQCELIITLLDIVENTEQNYIKMVHLSNTSRFVKMSPNLFSIIVFRYSLSH